MDLYIDHLCFFGTLAEKSICFEKGPAIIHKVKVKANFNSQNAQGNNKDANPPKCSRDSLMNCVQLKDVMNGLLMIIEK